ncbi:MAG: nucleotidyltransferase family protein [Hyphomicrobiaceae bacterium]
MSCPKVVILAGGKGTRLRPFTANFPKPLVPVGDKPILAILLHQLIRQGFQHVTITLGHLAELIRTYVAQSEELKSSLEIAYVDEDQPTGTAGSLASIPELTETFIVMNGDVLTNLDFNDLIAAHKKAGAALTIAGHAKNVKIDLGVLEADENGRLTGYSEKPEYNFDVSMGIYVYEPYVLEHIKPDEYLDFPTLVHLLLEAGQPVHVYRNDAFWLDIGRPDDYAIAQDIYENQPEIFGQGTDEECSGNTPFQNPPSELKNNGQRSSA